MTLGQDSHGLAHYHTQQGRKRRQLHQEDQQQQQHHYMLQRTNNPDLTRGRTRTGLRDKQGPNQSLEDFLLGRQSLRQHQEQQQQLRVSFLDCMRKS